jgi:hypothetical protein
MDTAHVPSVTAYAEDPLAFDGITFGSAQNFTWVLPKKNPSMSPLPAAASVIKPRLKELVSVTFSAPQLMESSMVDHKPSRSSRKLSVPPLFFVVRHPA